MRTTPELADIPVIVISSERCDPSSLPLRGGRGYVRKPFTPEAIRDVVEGLTAKKDAHWNADWLLERFDYVLQTVHLHLHGAGARRRARRSPAPGGSAPEMTFLGGRARGDLPRRSPVSLCADEMAINAHRRDELDDAELRQAGHRWARCST